MNNLAEFQQNWSTRGVVIGIFLTRGSKNVGTKMVLYCLKTSESVGGYQFDKMTRIITKITCTKFLCE